MLNQHAVESLYSATYVEDYLDSTENLPDDVMKKLTIMKEMDVDFQRHLSDLECQMKILLESLDPRKEAASKIKIQNILISAQDKGDEKLQIVQQLQDVVDNKVRQLELDEKNLEFGKDIDNDSRHDTSKVSEISDRPVKRARRARHEVFVPSILGPSTLEATSYHPEPSVNAAVVAAAAAAHAAENQTHHHNTKSNQAHSASSTHNIPSTNPTTNTISATANSTHVSHSSSNTQAAVASSSSSSHTETVERSTKQSSVNNHANEEKSTYSSTTTTTNTNTSSSTTTTPKKQTSSRKETQEKKVKRRKTTKQSDNSPPNIPIDPDEPTYCLCDQVSYGEMIGCDNDLCPIEWFHFSCVQLTTKPKGKWYCPKCRGDRPNVMKPKAIFLKELEKYNREKEEKS